MVASFGVSVNFKKRRTAYWSSRLILNLNPCSQSVFFVDDGIIMQASRARLFKEYKEVQREKAVDPDIQLVCDDSNIFKWTALIKVSVLSWRFFLGTFCLDYCLILLFAFRDLRKLLMKVVYFSWLLPFQSSTLYCLLKCDF